MYKLWIRIMDVFEKNRTSLFLNAHNFLLKICYARPVGLCNVREKWGSVLLKNYFLIKQECSNFESLVEALSGPTRGPHNLNILALLKKLCIILYMSVTYQPKKGKRAKVHGFLVRSKSKYGRNTIKRRRQKGRRKLSV